MRVGVVVGIVVVLMVAWMGPSPDALAQAKSDADLTDADRAKRDADKVFRFIKLQAQRQAAPAAPAAPRVATAPRAATATGPAAAPSPGAVRGPDVAALVATTPAATGRAAAPQASAAALAELPAAVAVAAVPAPSPVAEAQPSAAGPAPETEEIELAIINHVQPELPSNRLGNLRDGVVWVQFSVEPDGRTSHVVARPGAQLRLAQSAVKAVQQWRFAPISAAQDVAVEIAFKLN
jgi:TonB family protein